MGAFTRLLPLVVLFVVVAIGAFIGYQIYLWSNELADRGRKKMEKKNVAFTKDGLRVGVKGLSAEQVADRQQNYFVRAWNMSTLPNYKSRFWNLEEQARQKELAKGGAQKPTAQSASSSTGVERANNGLNVPAPSRPAAHRAGSNPGAFPGE